LDSRQASNLLTKAGSAVKPSGWQTDLNLSSNLTDITFNEAVAIMMDNRKLSGMKVWMTDL